MPYPCIPRFKRCCWCTRRLRVACVFIAIWSMLAICHSCGILLWPACPDHYTDNSLIEPLIYTKWILFSLNMLTALCSFGFLLALFLGKLLFFAELFILVGFLSALCMLCHAVIILTLIFSRKDNLVCMNPNDAIAHIIYFIVWCYFICIVNSHSYEMKRGY